MARIVVRKLHIDDLGKLLDLFSEHMFHIKPDRSTLQRLTKNIYFHYILNVPLSSLGLDTFIGLVAQAEDGNVVGAVIARRFPLGKSWVIGPVVVHTDFRRMGIATRMMNLVIKRLREKKAKSAILSVERNNIRARRLFEKFGFKYLEPIFSHHDRARNYVRRIALTYSLLHELPYEPTSLRERSIDYPQTRRKIWHIMLKEF